MGWSEAQRKAYAIADNKLSLNAGWDEELLGLGNVTAQIFWLKTRARWRETPAELQHSGSIGRTRGAEQGNAEVRPIVSDDAVTTGRAC
jgi:hypothetical protein